MFDINNTPKEVIEVFAHLMLKRPVGEETYKRLQETINKYPEYFPQQHIYNSIPKEVHQKYQEEKLNLYYSFYPPSGAGMKEGEGLVGYMDRIQEENKNKPQKSMKEVIVEIFETAPKIKKEYEKEKRKLWNKHYKKYKLRYEE